MSQTFRILATCEDPTAVVVVRQALGQAGHTVRTLDTGSDLVGPAGEYRPDLILVDVALLREEAFAASRALKSQESTAGIPVIFLTANPRPEFVVEAFSAGGSDYIAKPFTTQELLARVDLHGRLYRAEQALAQRTHELQELSAKLTNLSGRDPLTNLLNRRAMDEMVMQQHDRFDRYGRPYSILKIDVDHFRAYNGSCGQQTGDECLCRVADAVVS
ncbi:MAG: diguanylate cyclase, partial [Planctomycetes bacterium]|nr:diguanylate cyclase [Planctomycetota bacterium]